MRRSCYGTAIGVNVTVVSTTCTRHGLGGWMLITARLGTLNRVGGPGGIRTVSMFTTPPSVVMVVRARVQPPGQPATGGSGKVNGSPKTRVPGTVGVSTTVTTRAGVTVTVTSPTGVLTPVITMLGMDLGYFLGGVLIIESVFGLPGVGQLAYNGISTLDKIGRAHV